MTWPISNHESPDVDLTIPEVTAPHYLWAMLSTDGSQFRDENYSATRAALEAAVGRFSARTTGGQAPNPNVSDQRLRTWKTAFEEMGLLTVDGSGVLRATQFGKAVVDGLDDVGKALESANHKIARLGAMVANRVLLAKPDRSGNPAQNVPKDADLRPLRALWKAFRGLNNELHWQDINRVLGHIHYESELVAAIEHIRDFRRAHPSGYANEIDLPALGSEVLTDDPRHITPWFNRAGLGGILLPSEADTDGFRRLSSDSADILDGLLSEGLAVVPDSATNDRQSYVNYLMAPVERARRPSLTVHDQQSVENVLVAVEKHGKRKIVALAGIPGTGKSRLARIVADQLIDGDHSRLKEIQFHESTSYEDFVEGFVPRRDGQGFELRIKALRDINERAVDDPENKYVLLIEEFTRANSHSVMGELLTYIEHRNRRFTLAISQDEIFIAPNLIVLATFNPRDRSALVLDDAVSRRIHRINVPSSASSLVEMLSGTLPEPELVLLRDWFEKFQDDLPFGHGVFANASGEDILVEIWDGTVVPLLSDPLGRISDVFAAAVSAFPFGVEAGGMQRKTIDAQVEDSENNQPEPQKADKTI